MKASILLLGAAIQPGETVHELCPSCDGGSKSEKSLALTRNEDESLVWICHRATCSERGGTGSKGNLTLNQVRKQEKKKRPTLDSATEPLADKHLVRVQKMWGVTDPEHWYWVPERNRLAMSIRSPKYMHRGWVLRDIWGTSALKAITYLDEGEEGLSWYKTNPNAPTVLVEDIPSAVRASTYTNAVALLGTGLGMDRAVEINENAPKPIVLALDQDATGLSFKYANQYALLWGDVVVLPLERDLKDMKEDELCELLLQVGGISPTTND